MVVIAIILLAFLIAIIVGISKGVEDVQTVTKMKKELENEKIVKESLKKIYSEIRQKTEIPENCLHVYDISSEVARKNAEVLEPHNRMKWFHENVKNKILSGLNFIWIKDESICFFPTIGCIDSDCRNPRDIPLLFKIQSIKIQDIRHFTRVGEIFRETKISGGGGGGSSIGRAVIGGVIAGGAGAIIASRNKIDGITSELIEHDDRKCYLRYFQENEKKGLAFSYDSYEVFKELIPEKEINVVDDIKKRDVIEKNTTSQTDNIQKIRDLGTLRDEGILTQEEFEEKKRELLKKV